MVHASAQKISLKAGGFKDDQVIIVLPRGPVGGDVFRNRRVVDEFVIRPLRPTSRGLIVLTRKDAHRSWDGNIGRVVKIEVKFPQ
jgi:hypothetical protein